MTGTSPPIFLFLCVFGAVCQYMCDQRLRDGWIPDEENWPIVSSFTSLFICEIWASSLRNPFRLFNLCADGQQLILNDHFVAASGWLLAQHQRLPFPFLFSLARLTKQRFLGITSWAGHKEKREGKRENRPERSSLSLTIGRFSVRR